MVLEGVTEDSGSSSFNVASSTVAGQYFGEQVQCKVPVDEAQKCEAKAHASSLAPLDEYNDKQGIRYVVNGVFYAAFIVPGALMKWAFDNQVEDAVKKSSEIADKNVAACKAPEERTPASN